VYSFEGRKCSAEQMADYYADLLDSYPLVSIEDPMDEEDWRAGRRSPTASATGAAGRDDLFVTNPVRLARGIAANTANALLVKVNQIGTLTETLDAVSLAHRSGYRAMMSHRSGEDRGHHDRRPCGGHRLRQIKTGAPARSERVAKYNQLLRIEEELGDAARYAGRAAFPRFTAVSGA